MLLTSLLTKSTDSSTNACVFEGMPEVALRVTSHMKPNASTPMTADASIVSTLRVQNPPASNFCVRNVRWWPMYSVGLSYVTDIFVSGAVDDQVRTSRATPDSRMVTTNATSRAGSTTS